MKIIKKEIGRNFVTLSIQYGNDDVRKWFMTRKQFIKNLNMIKKDIGRI